MRNGTRVVRRARPRALVDDGFSLVEVVVAPVLTVVVMTVTAGFFIRGLAVSRLMQQRQSAVAVAEQAMERVRGQRVSVMLGARDNPLVTGQTDPGVPGGQHRLHRGDEAQVFVVGPVGAPDRWFSRLL